MTSQIPPKLLAFLKFASRKGPARVMKRLFIFFNYEKQRLRRGFTWIFQQTEESNFYYPLSTRNYRQVAHLISHLSGRSAGEVDKYFLEALSDGNIETAVADFIRKTPEMRDSTISPGRRLVWYALIRLQKPAVVLETGVHNGLGALIICSALQRNAEEGHVGKYFGTDINPKAGSMLNLEVFPNAKILIGDSIQSILKIEDQIDIYISDSDHSEGYESKELLAASSKLSDRGIVISDNSHATDVLLDWSEQQSRKFIFVPELSDNHWYAGAGAGISFTSKSFGDS